MALLLHKTALVNFPMATTVFLISIAIKLLTIPQLKAPNCGDVVSGRPLHSSILGTFYTHLEITILLSKGAYYVDMISSSVAIYQSMAIVDA